MYCMYYLYKHRKYCTICIIILKSIYCVLHLYYTYTRHGIFSFCSRALKRALPYLKMFKAGCCRLQMELQQHGRCRKCTKNKGHILYAKLALSSILLTDFAWIRENSFFATLIGKFCLNMKMQKNTVGRALHFKEAMPTSDCMFNFSCIQPTFSQLAERYISKKHCPPLPVCTCIQPTFSQLAERYFSKKHCPPLPVCSCIQPTFSQLATR